VPLAVRLLLALGALALALLRPASAAADGTPVVIPLRFLPSISNWGPTDATGEADVVLVEGEVRITTSGLPPLTTDLYQAWLFNTATGERLSLGKFNANAQNRGELATVVDLSGKVFDLVAITVQPEPDPKALPDARLSLAGFFPVEGTPTGRAIAATIPTPTPTAPIGAAPSRVDGTPATGAQSVAIVGPTTTATPLPAVPLKLPSTGGDNGLWLILVGGASLGVGAAIERRLLGKASSARKSDVKGRRR